MKYPFIALCLLTWSVATAHARIGETLEQLKARYGEGKEIAARMPETKQYEWEKDGYKINASLHNNVTVLEFFHRNDTMMTDADIRSLLKNYRKDLMWTYSSRDLCYKSSDKKMAAGRQAGHPDWIYVREIASTESMSGKDKAKGL